jgi:hypothetical protein
MHRPVSRSMSARRNWICMPRAINRHKASVASVPTLECFETEFGRPARRARYEEDDPVGGRLGWLQKIRGTFALRGWDFPFLWTRHESILGHARNIPLRLPQTDLCDSNDSFTIESCRM